ncbi:MAG: hypothetical protein K6G31_04130 [Paludibacteraceae bacterium]|nr:hypothetical protein [Paludibacteraceae bacterium]
MKRTDTIQTTVITDDDVSSATKPQPTYGGGAVLSNIEQNVRCVLEHGYDICDQYANNKSCRGAVLDIDALNRYRRILLDTNRDTYVVTNSGEGVEEYTKNIERKLNVSASASLFGASFSSETKSSFKEWRSWCRYCAQCIRRWSRCEQNHPSEPPD